MYNQNLSVQEFLYVAFVKIDQKILFLYNLFQEKNLNLKLIYEESSKILEVFRILKSQVDLNKETSIELIGVYNDLENLIYLGVNENSEHFLTIRKILKIIKA